MITLLRRIRKKTLSNNKTKTYFGYAIGEIILVVVGILIALSISNWNEQNKVIKAEKELLKSLEAELKGNIEVLTLARVANVRYQTHTVRLMDSINKGKSHFNQNFVEVFDYTPTKLDAPVLNEILNEDRKLKTSKGTLIEDLRDLKISYESVFKAEFYLDEFWNSKVTDFLIKTGTFKSKIFRDNSKISQERLTKMGYNPDQLFALIGIKGDLFDNWFKDQDRALSISKEVIEKLTAANLISN